MKIKLDWLHTDSIKISCNIALKYNVDITIEFDLELPQAVLEGTPSNLRHFVFDYYNEVNSDFGNGYLTEEDFCDCVIKN